MAEFPKQLSWLPMATQMIWSYPTAAAENTSTPVWKWSPELENISEDLLSQLQSSEDVASKVNTDEKFEMC